MGEQGIAANVTHFDPDPHGSFRRKVAYSVACGPTVYAARASTDPHDVTCRRCKATVAYKARVNGSFPHGRCACGGAYDERGYCEDKCARDSYDHD